MRKLFIFIGLSVFLGGLSFARIGVGVGTGKIVIDEPLKPGIIYELPTLTVLNTGDEPAEYEVGVAYHQDQKEQMPPKEWFGFKPSRFHLEPNTSQTVEITLTLPLKTVPGDYFAYLEGYPLKKQTADGSTNIGIAAAAKLNFTVAPANIFQGLFYRIKSFWVGNAPYTNIVLSLVVIFIIVKFVKKRFNINISVNKKWPTQEDAKKDQ